MKPRIAVKIADVLGMTQCLIFCRTNVDCNNLENYLNRLGGCKGSYGGKVETGKENPYSCVVLAGMRDQNERRMNLDAFKEGDVRFLVCTDVAARGIDVAGLPFVIQTTLPDDIENYIHRIGRCGRAEHMGLAISIVATEREKVWYHKCPSRGKNCSPWPGNTRLTIPFGPDQKMKSRDESKWIVDEGVCCIWYDEPDLVKQVEKRVGQPLAVMDTDDFSIPGIMESPLGDDRKKVAKARAAVVKEPPSRRAQKRKQEEAKMVVYGAKKNDATIAMSTKHTSALAPVVQELASLEKEIQQLFAQVTAGSLGIGGSAVTSKRTGKQATAVHHPQADVPARDGASGQTTWETSEPAAAGIPAKAKELEETKKVATTWAANASKPKRKARW
jgi:ATP-dependent RNA helicase DDX1